MQHAPTKHRILIVDDTPSIHGDYRLFLETPKEDSLADAEAELFGDGANPEAARAGATAFELSSAYQGQEALEMVKAAVKEGNRYRVAFVDMRMPPGWDGIETVEQLWRVDPGLDVVICTAFSDYSWSDITKRLGRSDRYLILKKPFEGIEVRQLAMSLVEKSVLREAWANQIEHLESSVAARTERLHQSESELERANARLQAAIESTNNGFLVEDIFGEIAVVNHLLPTLLGFESTSAARGRADMLLNAFAERGNFSREAAEEWLSKRANGAVIDQEVVLSLPEKRVLQVYSAPIRDLRGNVIGRVWSTCDRTEHRQLEESLLQSQKMDAVGQLAGGIAHDFNNLLSGILGNLALLKMELGDSVSDEARESLANAVKTGVRAADLVKQILGFSRRSRMDLKPCDANRILAEVRDILSATIDRRIEVELELETAPWRIMADVGMLAQVIMNMAVNAKDAMPKGGKLRLCSGNRVLTASDLLAHPEILPGDFVCLSVADEGEGIPAEVQAKIFEPFFTTKEPGKGTGLGLATSFGIVKQLGGWIDFHSVPGEGTRFDIYLPRSTVTESGADSTVHPGPGCEAKLTHSNHGETILLVDDEADVRHIGRKLLSKLGYEVLEAADGIEALELARTQGERIRLVLLDLTMPKLSGKETFSRLREIWPELPVLICSGFLVDLSEFTRECGSCPDGFVQKPYSFEDMADLVRNTLDNQSHAA
jgi:two-component system cell cycle sensor histidine kinase/response regulator CckA